MNICNLKDQCIVVHTIDDASAGGSAIAVVTRGSFVDRNALDENLSKQSKPHTKYTNEHKPLNMKKGRLDNEYNGKCMHEATVYY
jgi:hypothetical protein